MALSVVNVLLYPLRMNALAYIVYLNFEIIDLD